MFKELKYSTMWFRTEEIASVVVQTTWNADGPSAGCGDGVGPRCTPTAVGKVGKKRLRGGGMQRGRGVRGSH